MSDRVLVAALQRDRAVVLGALAALSAAAWAYLLWLADMPMEAMDGMPGMERMPGMDAPPMRHGPALAFSFATWTLMMVGMMTPAASPMILLYARVGRQAAAQGAPFAPAGFFAAGYLAAWTGFALIATLQQAALETLIVTSVMEPLPHRLGGALMVVAGLYQLSPWKQACLTACQHPLAFIQRHGGFRDDPAGAFTLGIRHGLYCVGCCWALMGLLFVAGVMNVLWIAALTLLALTERLVPGPWFARVTGAVLLLAGGWMLL